MPAPIRPKGSNSGSRTPSVAPMSERQQMALLMQMTSGNESGSRSPSSSSSRSRERNERGETPLHLAAIKGDVDQVCKLLAHRADPNVADFAGWTPLHEACNHGWYEVAFRLVQSGANVNARGLDNDTPLHDAAVNGHLKLVKLLVERGADIHAKNSKGKTPLDVAPVSVKPYLLNSSLPLPDPDFARRYLQAVRGELQNSPVSDSSDQGNQYKASSRIFKWNHRAIMLFLDMYREYESGQCKEGWKLISATLNENGIKVSPQQCSIKIDTLKRRFKSIKDSQSKTGTSTITWEYYSVMSELFDKKSWDEPLREAVSSTLASTSLNKIETTEPQPGCSKKILPKRKINIEEVLNDFKIEGQKRDDEKK